MKLKTNTKIVIAAVAAVLVTVILVGALGQAFGLFTKDLKDVTLRERNEANLLTGTFTDYNKGDGITATAKKDGSIVVKGENKSSGNITVEVEKVELKAGTYSLWGASKGSNVTYYMMATYVNDLGSAATVVADFTGNSFTISVDQTVTVSIVICPDAEVNATIRPVLCAGVEEVDFYA